jgi:hypothetical protein
LDSLTWDSGRRRSSCSEKEEKLGKIRNSGSVLAGMNNFAPLLILRIGIPVARAAATKKNRSSKQFQNSGSNLASKIASPLCDSSNWDSGPSGCSNERIEIRQNLGSDFANKSDLPLREFFDFGVWLLALTKRKEI